MFKREISAQQRKFLMGRIKPALLALNQLIYFKDRRNQPNGQKQYIEKEDETSWLKTHQWKNSKLYSKKALK